MIQNAERVLSREELLSHVWGYQNYPSTRTVDNHILRLRQKLEKNPANPLHFRTVHSSGYMFVPERGELRDCLVKCWFASLDAMKGRPSAAKAAGVAGSNGMAEACPFK